MASLEDAKRIARSLPGSRGIDGFELDYRGKLKGFAWVWNERIDPKKRRVPNPSVLAIRTQGLEDKEMLLAADPEKFFTEPHYNGYPAILVRLANIGLDELEELLIDGWRTLAPKELVEALDASQARTDGPIRE